MFFSSHFLFLITFGDEVTKIWKYYLIFVYILQRKMVKTKKKRKENHNKWTNKTFCPDMFKNSINYGISEKLND